MPNDQGESFKQETIQRRVNVNFSTIFRLAKPVSMLNQCKFYCT